MKNKIHYGACPLCQSTALTEVLMAKDHTVSNQLFKILECDTCSLRFTQDVPDADGIAPYYKSDDYISHSNSSKGLINSLYQFARNVTLIGKQKMIGKMVKLRKGKILDVGSGVGSFVNEMKRNGWDAVGLEPDADARAVALSKYKLHLSDIDQFYQFPSESFDAITLWHVLEHVHDLHNYVDQLKKMLKPAGRIFIAVPNYTALDAKKFQEYWAAYDVPRHLYHFSPASIKQLMNLHGLTIEKYRPMWFDSFYIAMLSNKYKTGSPKLLNSYITGTLSNLKAMVDFKKCSSVIYIIKK